MKKILLLFGGNSSEHLVSCKSAKSILEHIDNKKYHVTAVGISSQNDWYLYRDTIENILEWQNHQTEKIDAIIPFLKQFDVVFPIIHGTNGEDGKIQGLLELFRIPYIGCNSKISSIGMDKHYFKILLSHFHLPVVPFLLYQKGTSLKKIENTIPYPIIIKPCNGGSSIGITTANNRKELKKGIKIAQKYDTKILLEPFLNKRELECAILENKKNFIISPLGEIRSSHTFYDYEAKYIDNSSKAELATDIPKEAELKIKAIAKAICTHLEIKGLSRIDFFYLPEEKKIYVNEINTIPGFTTISMYPKLLTSDKFTYQDLLATLIENAHY